MVDTRSSSAAIAQQFGTVLAAHEHALNYLPRFRVVLVRGLPTAWEAMHCCQELHVALDQPDSAVLQAVLDGIAVMVERAGGAGLDEVTLRRIRHSRTA